MKDMTKVGIRALEQNASGVVADAAAGTTITITNRGRPLAQLTAIPMPRLQGLAEAGLGK